MLCSRKLVPKLRFGMLAYPRAPLSVTSVAKKKRATEAMAQPNLKSTSSRYRCLLYALSRSRTPGTILDAFSK